jgi:hypothetical protein
LSKIWYTLSLDLPVLKELQQKDQNGKRTRQSFGRNKTDVPKGKEQSHYHIEKLAEDRIFLQQNNRD